MSYDLLFGAGFLYYAVIKLTAYTAFFLFASPLLGIERPGLWKALGLGFQRVALGVVLGLFVYLLILPLASTTKLPKALTYAIVFIPFRWAEWAIMETFVQKGETTLKFALVPRTPDVLMWRLLGVGVSFLTDILLNSGAVPGLE